MSTARVAVLLLVLAGLALSAVLPLRTYLEQRSQISALEREVEEERAGVASLEVTAAQWQDPVFVSAQARARLRLVAPGETGYIVTDSGPAPATAPPSTPAVPSTPATAPTRTVAPSTPGAAPTTPPDGPAPTAPVGTSADGLTRLGSPSPWWSPSPAPTPGR